jgi:hypothetical protein
MGNEHRSAKKYFEDFLKAENIQQIFTRSSQDNAA